MVQSLWNIVWRFLLNGFALQVQQLLSWGFLPEKLQHFHTGAYMQMFTTVLFVIAKKCKLCKCPPMDNGFTMVKPSVEPCVPQNTTQQLKRTNYWYTKQFGWISRELCYVKKQISKSSTLYDYLYDIPEWQNYTGGEEISSPQGLRMGKGWGECGYKGVAQALWW